MATASFDTLTYAKKLQEAGFTSQQAEAQAEALRAVVDQNLATKQDIADLRRDIEELRAATKHDIELVRRDMKEMETRLEVRLAEMETRITLRLGALIVAGVGVLAVLMKLL